MLDVALETEASMADGTERAGGFEFNQAPDKQCDLVMKGGITSGVVYPPAILELQRTFRFRCIGGTSAGAIAAAVTAAAEYAREGGGFQRLDELREQLAKEGFLLQLFKPAAKTAPAFRVLADLFLDPKQAAASRGSGKRRGVASMLLRASASLARNFSGPSSAGWIVGGLLGLVPAALVMLGVALAGGAPAALAPAARVFVGALALVGALAGALVAGLGAGTYAFSRIFTQHLPRDGHFGLCMGYTREDDKDVLTTWLADRIDALAGKKAGEPPLTFADLAGKKLDGGSAPVDISLRMVTSNLSLGQPYVFPRPGHDFLFREDEMARFFPERIVSYMKAAGTTAGLPLPKGYYYLPEGDKLPVVVATRLSLSFPILLTALRFYTIKPTAFAEMRARERAGQAFEFDPARHFQDSWFSDGGISSNFPIHFFDTWLPGRPTFGINLADVPDDAKSGDTIASDQFSAVTGEFPAADEAVAAPADEEEAAVKDVYLPHPREGARGVPQWAPVEGLPGFLMAMFDTARNYRDTMQAMLPSYRERVVQVRLTSKEGGLNLAMDPETIRHIGDKGRRAGELLAAMDFRQHQWVRFRVLMSYLEKNMHRVRETFPDLTRYQGLFNDQLSAGAGGRGNGARWYKPQDAIWCQKALVQIKTFVDLGDAWQRKFFSNQPPKPDASLRVTPPL
jgi:predicted acylesterase/phospholipase RssA